MSRQTPLEISSKSSELAQFPSELYVFYGDDIENVEPSASIP